MRHLLVHRGTAVHEEQLFEAFWPGKSPAAARRSLQVAVSCARAVLDLPWAETSALEVSDRVYRLRLRDGDLVDADAFAAAARAALGTQGSGRRDTLLAAAALWTGEPLPEERYEDWAVAWRESMVDLYGDLLSALADAHAEAGDTAGALSTARALVDLDPVAEGAHRRLMLAYCARRPPRARPAPVPRMPSRARRRARRRAGGGDHRAAPRAARRRRRVRIR